MPSVFSISYDSQFGADDYLLWFNVKDRYFEVKCCLDIIGVFSNLVQVRTGEVKHFFYRLSPLLDIIVLSFKALEQRRKKTKKTNASAGDCDLSIQYDLSQLFVLCHYVLPRH